MSDVKQLRHPPENTGTVSGTDDMTNLKRAGAQYWNGYDMRAGAQDLIGIHGVQGAWAL
jgi:hypothetical protein